ncbi:MAG: Nif3-like dinuclear metal center hexameric protein [Bacteroidales bacterium]|nr:Nif3-like dinuclear metal center hexameric protein [Bacteroidales bacterium]
MKISEIAKYLDQKYPLSLQESYDNCGWLIGEPEAETTGALITLDITEEVLKEAIHLGLNLVIAHHPIIFKGLKRISGQSEVERCVRLALRHGLSIYAAHTNLDHSAGGVSFALAEKLGLKNVRVLRPMDGQLRKLVTFCPASHVEEVRQAMFAAGAGQIGNYDQCSFSAEGYGTFRAGTGAEPYVGSVGEQHREPETRIETVFPTHLTPAVLAAMHSAHPYEEVAYDLYTLQNSWTHAGPGVLGNYDLPLPAAEFLSLVKTVTGVGLIRHTFPADRMVSTVALCGGAGSFLIHDAVKAGADAFVTADLKYHDFHDAAEKLLLVDSGHYETEQFAREVLKAVLLEKFPNFAVLISNVNTNPVYYL